MRYCLFPLMILISGCVSCTHHEISADGNQNNPPQQLVKAPDFNADSAYEYTAKQVTFGPRIPETKAHAACLNYLIKKLKEYTPDVEVQTGSMKRYDGKMVPIQNILAHFGKEKQNRILLSSHWDTRPWADQDPDSTKWHNTFDGANDGASGIGVLIEVARQLTKKRPDIGVTLLLVDVEDMGTPTFEEKRFSEQDTYCLGTQYFGQHIDKTKHEYSEGIVLDMVGGRFARFLMEEESVAANSSLVEKVWHLGIVGGYSNYFIYNHTGGVTDDHVYLSRIAQVPTIDIIDKDDTRQKGFPSMWHTTADNMSCIDKNTLKAVGQTLLTFLYNEKPLF